MWNMFKKIRAPTFGTHGIKYGFLDPNYKWYALLSWGCPLIVTFVTLGMQLDEEKYTNTTVITPGIGERSHNCFLSDSRAPEEGYPRLYYFDIINVAIWVGILTLKIHTCLTVVS